MQNRKKTKKYLTFAGLVLAFFVLAVSMLRSAGTFLVKSDAPQKPTPTIILMGSIPDRVLQAFDIYNQGLTCNPSATGIQKE